MSAPPTPATAIDNYISNVVTSVQTSTNQVIPLSLIAAIIAFISQIISGCIPTPTPKTVIAGGGTYGKIVIYRAMRANGVRPLSDKGEAILTAMQVEAAKLSDDDARAFLSLSQGG